MILPQCSLVIFRDQPACKKDEYSCDTTVLSKSTICCDSTTHPYDFAAAAQGRPFDGDARPPTALSEHVRRGVPISKQ